MIVKNLCLFGANRTTIQKTFKKLGLNSRLNSIYLKLKHKNKILNRLSFSNPISKTLETKISTFKSFYQQINYNKFNLKNGTNSKKKIFQKVQKKKKN